MKKKTLVLLMGLLIILGGWGTVGCSSPAQPEEGVVEVWATWGDEATQLQSLFDRFSQSSGIPVRVTTRVGSDDLLATLAGSGQPDLVILSNGDLVGAYAKPGVVEPLDGWIEATGIDLQDIFPAPLGQCAGPEGATLCLPWGCDVDALFWNKDLFRASGLDPERPPQTMEEVVEYAHKLTVRDEQGELVQAGFIPDFFHSHTDLYASLFGGGFYDEGGAKLALNSQPVINALEWQAEVYDLYAPEDIQGLVDSFTPYMTSRHATYAGKRLDCQQCHHSAPIHNGKTPEVGFHLGRIAMMIGSQSLMGSAALSEENPVDVGLAPFPPPAAYPERAGTNVVSGPVVIMPSGAADKEAAAELLAWMMTPEIVADMARTHTLLPTSRTAARDPRFQENPGCGLFIDLLAQANAAPALTSPISSELNQALGRVEEELLHKGGDPVTVLNGVQGDLAPKLKEGVAYHNLP